MKIFFISLILITFPLFVTAQCEVLINEVLFNPDGPLLGDENSMHEDGSTGTAEWVELYNPSACNSVDISCWILGSNENGGDNNYGMLVFPAGTVIPPHGFIVIGGAKAPKVDFNTQTSSNYCGARRWFLRNQHGWVALYDKAGLVKDAVYWSMDGAAALNTEPEFSNAMSANPNNKCKCDGTTLNATPAKSMVDIEFAGTSTGITGWKRSIDGAATWVSETQKEATPKAYNGTAPIPLSAKINGVNADCGTKGSATVTASGGNPPYTYLWSNGSNDVTIKDLAGGTYTCEVKDACGCVTNATVIITAKNPLIINVDVTPAHCKTPNGSATVTVTGNSATYKFEWNTTPAQTTQTASNLPAGVYTVKVTDAAGCEETKQITVNSNTAPLTSDSVSAKAICTAKNGMAGIVPTSGQGPYTYVWNTKDTVSTINNLSPGIYTVVFSDAFGCTGSRQITVDLVKDSLMLSTTVKDETCGNKNGEITLNATGGTLPYSYLWSNNTTAQHLSNVSAGTYTVTVKDLNGCTGTQTSVLSNISTLKITNTIINDHCSQGKGSISVVPANGQAPFKYIWNTSDTTATLANLYTGTYSVIVKDALGCETPLHKFDVKNIDDVFTGNIVGNSQLQQDQMYTISANIPADWNLLYWIGIKGDTIKKPALDLYFPYPLHGNFTVKLFVKSIYGCTDFVKFDFTVITFPTFYVPNCVTLNGDGINEYFFPKFTDVSELQGWVFNRWGENIYTFKDLYDKWDGTCNGEKVKEDIYVYRFVYKDLQGTKRERVGSLLILRSPVPPRQ